MDRRWVPMKSSPEIAPHCPRCASSNTKFCYYNNYSLSQPRYFCKGCRRYWTKGGSLRNVPVGGGCRKSRRGRSSSRPLTSSADTISSYMSRSHGGDPLLPRDATSSNYFNGHDIDMAAVFAKFLDPNSETEFRDQETEDDPFFELTSSLGSNNQGSRSSFLIDCDNDTQLFGREVIQEFSVGGDENFEASYDTSFGLDDLLSDQVPGPEALWSDLDGFIQPIVSFSDDYDQMKVSSNGIADNWSSCFDVTSFEVFSKLSQ